MLTTLSLIINNSQFQGNGYIFDGDNTAKFLLPPFCKGVNRWEQNYFGSNRIFMHFCIKLASCKSALNPTPSPVVYSTDRSKAVAPVLVLYFMSYLVLFCSRVFQFF